MQCVNCKTNLDKYAVFCPICGQSQASQWFNRSSYCYGGYGTRHHVYQFTGISPSLIEKLEIPAGASYPVHFRDLLMYVNNNQLVIHGSENTKSIELDNNREQGFHPIIVPPLLILFPNRIKGRVLKFNLLSLAESMLGEPISPTPMNQLGDLKANSQSMPAVIFDSANPLNTYKIVFWSDGKLLLLEAGSDSLQEIHQIPGGGDDRQFNPCFDNNGDVWFSGNSYKKVFQINLTDVKNVHEYRYEGSLSAPTFIDGYIHLYQCNGGESHLIRFPQVEICSFAFIPDLPHPPHALSDAAKHPLYIVEIAIAGLRESMPNPESYSDLKDPIWLDMNGVNHLVYTKPNNER